MTKRKIYLIVVIPLIFFVACKSPEESLDYFYRTNVEVKYLRDASKITNPTADDSDTTIEWDLYDPERGGEF